MSLKSYQKKRDFRKTPEPRGRKRRSGKKADPLFVVQKHDASRLHYDFRLELDGTLKSWAVPKGPSIDPDTKRLAVQVEDHPLEYAEFEGTIPQDEYGGGTVLIWDRGTWHCEQDAAAALRKGKLSFDLDGQKLGGAWTLVRMSGSSDDKKNWLLIKADDEFASAKKADDPLRKEPDSASTGRSLEEIADDGDAKNPPKKQSKVKAKKSSIAGNGTPKTKKEDIIDLAELGDLKGARQGSPPKTFHPQLATLTRVVPAGDRWLHEIKFDGYRILAVCHEGKWMLLSRSGKDWTARLPAIAEAVRKIPLDEGVIDGEVVVLNENGVSDFQALQNALRRDARSRMYYYVFDLPYCNGYNLTGVGQLDRKRALQGVLAAARGGTSHIRFSDHLQGEGDELLRHACKFALEGLVSKRVDGGYAPKRSRNWLKVKCSNRQEFVIVGFTDPRGSRKGLGALLVGVHDGKTLRFSGKVGTGFTEQTLADLHKALAQLEVKNPQVEGVPPSEARGAHWVKPELVAEVEFAEWTADGRLRQPVYHGLREDKPPEQVKRESPASQANGQPSRQPAGVSRGKSAPTLGKKRSNRSKPQGESVVAGVTLTHPDKVLYPEQTLTKRDLAAYYEQIADWILPHVVERPLSIVRCPGGHTQKCFYQKHITPQMGPAVHGVKIKEKRGEADYIYVKDLSGIIALVQIGVLEIHPWGSQVDRYDRPDRLVFDLDPDPSLKFADTIVAARLVRDRLAGYDLESFVKTTGGKGLHVVVPLVRRNSWDEIRDFSQALARDITRNDPDRYVANIRKEKRKNRVLIDYLRNASGATSVAAYSSRARPGAPVATPLRWDELTPSLDPANYTVSSIPQRLASLKKNPWQDLNALRQSITNSMLRAVR